MGLTGGLADIGGLFDSLIGIHCGLTDDSILDVYSDIRRKKWAEIIDPMSRANFRRIWAEDALPEREAFFEMCKGLDKDEAKALQAATVSPPWQKIPEPQS